MKEKYLKRIIVIGAIIISLVLLIILVIDLFPLVRDVIQNSHDEAKTIDYIKAYGAKGVPILIGLQFIFSLVPVLPSALVQVLSGLCYGIWLGALICITGTIISNSLLFILTRQSKNFLGNVLHKNSKEKHNKLSEKLKNINKPERMAFILYLIPFIPSSILPTLFAESKITYPKFLLSLTAACVPINLIYCWLGDRLSKGDYQAAIIIACAIIVLVGVAFVFRKKILN